MYSTLLIIQYVWNMGCATHLGAILKGQHIRYPRGILIWYDPLLTHKNVANWYYFWILSLYL